MAIHRFICVLGIAALGLPVQGLAQGHPHEHGAARLDIAVEAGKLSLQLEAPLEALVGFERAPRTDAQRQRVDAAVARLKAADTLFEPDPASGCVLAKVELDSAVLELGPAAAPVKPAAPEDEHADLDASIEFRCKDTARLSFIDTRLFEAFAALQRIDVQVAAPKGQFKRSLKRPARRITLTR